MTLLAPRTKPTYDRRMTDRSRIIPRDLNARAESVALGRKGGLKGDKARAAKMTPEERSEAAKKAPEARRSKR